MQTIYETSRSVCPLDCPDACSLTVYKENGKITRVNGNQEHPVTQGAICNKIRHVTERIYHSERVLYPLRRIGKKGDYSFKRISWDEAYVEIVDRFQTLIKEFGAEAILPYSFYGNMGILNAEGMDRRFFHRLGASKLDRAICNRAGAEGYRLTMGVHAGIDAEETVHSKLIIIWGCNIVSTNMHQVVYANEARKNGATIVHIDVHRNRTAKWADWFIPIFPGTDGALALGLMHVLIAENLVNQSFIDQYTKGYTELADKVKEYTPERVSLITGVPVDDIVRLARLYGTTTPSFIRIGNGLQHHDNGGMNTRAIVSLPALTGQWGIQGGGAMKGNGWYAGFNMPKMQRPDLHPNPNVRTVNMNQLGAALTALQLPIQALFVYNSNPAIVAPDTNQVRKGLMRENLFTVVHDLFLTDTCRYADIVLPATSHFENLDLYKSYWHMYLQLHEPVIPPQGEAKSNFTLFKELALRMGFEEKYFNISEQDMIADALDSTSPFLAGITFETLKERGWQKLNKRNYPLYPKNTPTRSGKIELYADELVQMDLPPVPEYMPILEKTLFPLLFVPGPNHHFLNSTFGNVMMMKQFEGKPMLDIHKEDADKRGIQEGDMVRIWNNRGECRLYARVGHDVLPGVVVSQGLWWDDQESGLGSVNALTSQRVSRIGGGATFFSTRVEIEPV